MLFSEGGEYAGWVLTNGLALNHTAISVHRLQTNKNSTSENGHKNESSVHTIESLLEVLVNNKFNMNAAGGVIKKSEGITITIITNNTSLIAVDKCRIALQIILK